MRDDIGVHVIGVEEILDRQPLVAGLEMQRRRHRFLHVHRQQVVLAPVLVMQRVANPEEEIQRRFHGLLVLLRQQPFVLQVLKGFGAVERIGNPARGMVIPQPSRALLHVRLHQVHGIGEGGVALAALRYLSPDETAPPARGEPLLVNLLLEPAVELVVAFQESAFPHRRLGGQVGLRHLHRVPPRPHAVAQGVAGVPEQVERLAHHLLGRRLVTEEHQIDVRVGVHLPPAVPPKSQQRAGFRAARIVPRDVLENRAHHVVCQRGEVPDDIAAACPRIVLAANAFVCGGYQRLQALEELGTIEPAVQQRRKGVGLTLDIVGSAGGRHLCILWTGMMLRVHRPQALLGDVRIDLGGRNVGVAQHVLKGPQISPACQEMGCEGMTQGMRTDLLVNGHLLDVLFHDLPQRLPAEPVGGAVDEQGRRLAPLGELGASGKQVILQTFRRHLSHRHESFLVALAAHQDDIGGSVHVSEVQGRHFAGTQARAVEEFQQGGVTLAQGRVPVRRFEKALDLLQAQYVRQLVFLLRGGNLLGGIVSQDPLFAQKTIQGLNGDQFAGRRACRNTLFPPLRKVACNVVRREAQKGRQVFSQNEIPEAVQVGEIGGKGIARQAFFDDQVLLQLVEMMIE